LGQVFNNVKNIQFRRMLRKNQTEVEKIVWNKLRSGRFFGIKFFRQYGIGNYIADFYCPEFKIVVELDGGQHFEGERIEYDKKREEYMLLKGVKTLRFTNFDILHNLDGIIEHLKNIIEEIKNKKI